MFSAGDDSQTVCQTTVTTDLTQPSLRVAHQRKKPSHRGVYQKNTWPAKGCAEVWCWDLPVRRACGACLARSRPCIARAMRCSWATLRSKRDSCRLASRCRRSLWPRATLEAGLRLDSFQHHDTYERYSRMFSQGVHPTSGPFTRPWPLQTVGHGVAARFESHIVGFDEQAKFPSGLVPEVPSQVGQAAH